MTLEEIGWGPHFSSQHHSGPVGRVALARRENFVVWTDVGETEAIASGRLRHETSDWPCVGDWVVLREYCVITQVLPRRTTLLRKKPGKEVEAQVLAANIDVLFIVSGLDRDYNPRRLERYLTLAHESGARPVILLNKSDLRPDFAELARQTERIAPGIPVQPISALTGWGIDKLSMFVEKAQTAALIGSSGAGKSTIVNRLLGEDRQRTNFVSDHSRGRHTTTQRELFLLPQGRLLMDLPGLRELQLWADSEQVDETFADISDLARLCRFSDCTHQHEPGCAVKAADLDEDRLANYHKLKKELAYLDRQIDANLARETKKRWKAIHKSMRHHPKR